MQDHFKKAGDCTKGLTQGILKAGEELQHVFSTRSETDVNELPNTISKG